jgi:ribosomal protein L11 methyltransferase
VFFRLASQRDAARTALAAALGDRAIELSPAEVPDDDWARRSQAALTAIRVGDVIVAPPWDTESGEAARDSGLEFSTSNPRIPNSGPITVVIEPSMGFGTGHHATTRLCLMLLQEIELLGKSLLDIGTGSGVLAIAASKLGAAPVTALDNDPDALQNARENVARNAATDAIRVEQADLSAALHTPADVVVANLTGAVLQRHASALRRMAKPGGLLIVSGFSPAEMDDVFAALGMQVAERREEGEWAAALLVNGAEPAAAPPPTR